MTDQLPPGFDFEAHLAEQINPTKFPGVPPHELEVAKDRARLVFARMLNEHRLTGEDLGALRDREVAAHMRTLTPQQAEHFRRVRLGES